RAHLTPAQAGGDWFRPRRQFDLRRELRGLLTGDRRARRGRGASCSTPRGPRAGRESSSQDRAGRLRILRALWQADLAGPFGSSAGDGFLHRLRLGSPLTTGARLRSLGSNPKLPTYVLFTAIGVLDRKSTRLNSSH